MAGNIYYSRLKQRRKTSKQPQKLSIDRWVYFAVVFGPIMTIPQVYAIWVLGQKQVSIITWSAYLLIAIIWLAYGIKHKDRPIISMQIIWLLLDLAIIAGLLL